MADVLLTALAADTDALYNNPVAVAVIAKASTFPFLQELGYNGQLSWLQQNFLGLKDFSDEMTIYSANVPLIAPWASIKALVPLNLEVLKKIFISPTMGPVGDAFLTLLPLTQVFAVQAADLADATGASAVASNLPSS
jgi:hypothetical protein